MSKVFYAKKHFDKKHTSILWFIGHKGAKTVVYKWLELSLQNGL